jgi:hypothetical protein
MSESVKVVSTAGPFLAEVIDREGFIEPGRLSGALRVTRGELALAAGLSRDAVSKTTRLNSLTTQKRLREVAEVINRVLPWCGGSLPMALAWYRSQPIPAFGDQTAENLVQHGRAEHILDYLGGISRGGYA